MLPGIHTFAGGDLQAQKITFQHLGSRTTSGNAVSFSEDIGAPRDDRLIIVAIAGADNEGDEAASFPATITVGGVSINRQVEDTDGDVGEDCGCAIYSGPVTTGSGTVTIDMGTVASGGTWDSWVISTFRADGVGVLNTAVGGNSLSLNTSGASLVVLAASDITPSDAASAFTGGGNSTTTQADLLFGGQGHLVGYDDAPLGGNPDVYNANDDTDTFVGVALG